MKSYKSYKKLRTSYEKVTKRYEKLQKVTNERAVLGASSSEILEKWATYKGPKTT